MESLHIFGQPMPEVHKWLDEFASGGVCGMRHRQYLHHLAGIQEAGKRFGPLGASVARQHIMSDLKMEGWTEDQGLPMDRADYVRRSFF